MLLKMLQHAYALANAGVFQVFDHLGSGPGGGSAGHHTDTKIDPDPD